MTEVHRRITPEMSSGRGSGSWPPTRHPFGPPRAAPPRLVPPPGLAEAVVARVCHDLAGPLGAVANGVELLALGGEAGGPELSLVTDSAEAATARLRLLRLAFGPPGGPPVSRPDMVPLLAAVRGERLSIEWRPTEALPRAEARIAALGVLCLDAALPRGGRIEVSWDGRWRLDAEGSALAAALPVWSWLTAAIPTLDTSAESVSFPLLRLAAESLGRTVALRMTATEATLVA